MNEWPTLFLAVIATSTGVMALIQIGVIIYGARLARRLNRLAMSDRIERDVDPFLGRAHEMSADAARATRLAVAQVERADELMTRVACRAEELLDVAQHVVVEPARQGLALLDALRAMFSHETQPTATQTADTESTEEDEAAFGRTTRRSS